MSRRPTKQVDRNGEVISRELARIISHLRRSNDGSDLTDATVAAGLLERYEIKPRKPRNHDTDST